MGGQFQSGDQSLLADQFVSADQRRLGDRSKWGDRRPSEGPSQSGGLPLQEGRYRLDKRSLWGGPRRSEDQLLSDKLWRLDGPQRLADQLSLGGLHALVHLRLSLVPATLREELQPAPPHRLEHQSNPEALGASQQLILLVPRLDNKMGSPNQRNHLRSQQKQTSPHHRLKYEPAS